MDAAAWLASRRRWSPCPALIFAAVGAAAAGRGQPAPGALPPLLRGRVAKARAQSRPVRAQPPALAAAGAAAHRLGDGFASGLRPAFLSGPLGFAADILLLDLWIYWWHRANHELPFLWRFHAVHHYDELLDTSSARALPLRRGGAVRAGPCRRDRRARRAPGLGGAVRGPGAGDRHLPSFRRAPAAAAGAAAQPGDRDALDPLGAPPCQARRHRKQLRHDLQLLGPAVPARAAARRARPGCRSASRARATGRSSACWRPRSARQAGTNGATRSARR